MPRSPLSIILDLLFPPRCMGCGRRGGWLCPACDGELRPVSPPLCARCGRQWDGRSGDGRCPACRGTRSGLDGLRAAYYFEGPIRRGIHGLKYRGQRSLAEPLTGLLLPAFDALPWAPDVVVPVPLYPSRQRQRGYNQSKLLAGTLARERRLEMVEGAVLRRRDTPPQIGLDAAARRANVAGAFAGKPGALAGWRVLLLDDVCTTGSTLEACADAAREAGAVVVWGLVLARPR